MEGNILNTNIVNTLNNSNTSNNFLNSPDPITIINESFKNFLIINNLTEDNVRNNLTREKFSEWNFINDIEDRHKLNLTSNKFLNTIPNLTDFYTEAHKNNPEIFSKIKKGTFVKFNCMIQNVFENQLYMSLGFDSKQNYNLVLNKFHEYDTSTESYNDMLIDGEEDLYKEDNMTGSILAERLSLNCVIIPGLSPTLCNEFNHTAEVLTNLDKKKIIIYDYTNSSHKVNEEILVVGVAYERENEIIIHSWKILINYIQNRNIINTSNINLITDQTMCSEFNYKYSRELIFSQFKKFLNDDEVLAEYLVYFLTSQIFSRVGTHFIGKLSLNIINQKETIHHPCDYFIFIQNFIKLISNFAICYTPTIKSLNSDLLYPRFDVNTEELVQGSLQNVSHTFLLIDERQLCEGKLEDNGCKNFSTLKNLIDFQLINYEYPYSKVEIQHDTQILVVTDKIKSVFNSMQLIEIPYLNNENTYDINHHLEGLILYEKFAVNFSESDISNLRLWFSLTRYSDAFNKNFKIADEISLKIQKDFLERKNNFDAEDLDICMKLGRLNAISYGRSEMEFEDYLHAKEIERKRKERLANYKK